MSRTPWPSGGYIPGGPGSPYRLSVGERIYHPDGRVSEVVQRADGLLRLRRLAPMVITFRRTWLLPAGRVSWTWYARCRHCYWRRGTGTWQAMLDAGLRHLATIHGRGQP